MGGSLATLQTEKNVVIVGGSFAGRLMTYGLQQADTTNKLAITIVDKSPHFEFNCTNYKSLCDGESFKFLAEPHANILKTYNLDPSKIPVKFVQGRLDKVNHSDNTITLSTPDGQEQVLPFDALVLATGATYTAPWRDGPDEMKSMEQRDDDYKNVRDAIKQAKSVLVAGAGATGLEAAGYLKERFPDHKIGVCMRGNTFLPYIKGAHAMVERCLKEAGVEVHQGTSYEGEETAKQLGYEYHVDCRGYKFVAPRKYMQGDLANCVDNRNGQIQVNYFGQACDKYPPHIDRSTNEAGTVYGNVFSVGDVCLNPAGENKSIVSMYQYMPIVAQNVVQHLAGGPLKQTPDEFVVFQAIPVGTKKGLVCINNKVMIKPDVQKMKDDIEKQNMAQLRCDLKALKEGQDQGKSMGNFFGMLKSTCCCVMCCGCCGVHYCFKRG